MGQLLDTEVPKLEAERRNGRVRRVGLQCEAERARKVAKTAGCGDGMQSNSPPFDFAQGKLCRRRRDKDGAPSAS
jgi:hypothetical protein